MPVFRRKCPEHVAYQFTGDDVTPGWPEGFVSVTLEYQPDGADKKALVSGAINSYTIRKGEWLVRSARTGEFFGLSDEFMRSHYEEIAP